MIQDISEKFDISQKFKDRNADLAHFNRILKQVSKQQERPYSRYGFDIPHIYNNYKYELKDIIDAKSSLDIRRMRKISRYFYNNTTSYRRIIDTFAQIYKYYYVVDFKGASDSKNKKTILRIYNETLNFLDGVNIRDVFGFIS